MCAYLLTFILYLFLLQFVYYSISIWKLDRYKAGSLDIVCYLRWPYSWIFKVFVFFFFIPSHNFTFSAQVPQVKYFLNMEGIYWKYTNSSILIGLKMASLVYYSPVGHLTKFIFSFPGPTSERKSFMVRMRNPRLWFQLLTIIPRWIIWHKM